MARRSYGRTRRSRRKSHNSRWGYVIAAVILVFLIILWWGGSDTPTPSDAVAGNPPSEEQTSHAEGVAGTGTDVVMQAGEFSPILSNSQSGDSSPVNGTNVGAPAGEIPLVAVRNSAQVDRTVREAMALWKQNSDCLLEVRTRLNSLLLETMGPESQVLVKEAMEQLSERWLFSRQVFDGDPLCDTYLVQSGNRLATIGRHYRVPYEILMQINGLAQATDLKADSTIKVVRGPFHARVNLSSFSLDIYLQQTFVKSYRIGIGSHGHETPTGTWLVKPGDKHIRPQWTDPNGRVWYSDDPDYPLGDRWIGLLGVEYNAVGRSGFAIHGTKDPQTIGKQSSQGCVRLNNGDVREVYRMLLEGESKVFISP